MMGCVVQLTGLSSIHSANLSNYHISLWRKVFFFFLTNFFLLLWKLPTVAKGYQIKCKCSRLLGTWYLAVFQNKLGTKLFIFTLQKKYCFIIFYLVLTLESFSGVKSWFYGKNHSEYNFQSKTVKLSYFTLEKFFSFLFLTNFFSQIWKLPTVGKGYQKKCKCSRLFGTWYLAVFQKKLGTKLFILRLQKNIALLFFT
jgi:hypothetical protein